MHLDVSKIDERIQKLQEVRRIANDSELLRMIAEFLVADDRPAEPAPTAKAAAATAGGASRVDDADLVNQLMKDMDVAGGGSLWSRARAGKGA